MEEFIRITLFITPKKATLYLNDHFRGSMDGTFSIDKIL